MPLVTSGTQQIIVDPATQAISIVNAGPVGPAGAQGPPGQGGEAISFEYTQVSPSTSWVINHNLGYRPNVAVEEAGTGHEISCAVIYHSINQLELQFNTSRAGTAHLS